MKKLSEERKRKISEGLRKAYQEGRRKPYWKGKATWNKGKKGCYSEETLKKMSEAGKGQVPWNKGKKLPNMAGPKNANWKGGRFIRKDGYVLIYSPGHPSADPCNRILEHRMVMEQFLSELCGERVYLTSNNIVHHINGKRSDNRLENLLLFRNHHKHNIYHHTLHDVRRNILQREVLC